MKCHVSRKTLLMHPKFNWPFDMHTEVRIVQLVAIISQASQPIAYYLRKLQNF